MARILYGKEVSSALWERLLPRIDRLRAHGVAPTLAIVRVGERPDDLSYERTCARQADLHGIAVRRFVLPTEATQAELEAVCLLYTSHADGVVFEPAAQKEIAQLEALGFGEMPVCMAKTQYSFSDDATKLGAPRDFQITVRQVKVSAGAGFIVALTGSIMLSLIHIFFVRAPNLEAHSKR